MYGVWWEGVAINWLLFVCLLSTLPARSLLVPLEAAFQGRCEDGNPCDQTCFNLHDHMYECDCTEGFYLDSNGYTCIQFAKNESVGGPASSQDQSIAIQIEVDIEPPEEGEDLSDDQLSKLGLPSHHVHYRAGQPAGTELLAPEDIQVSYTVREEEEEETGVHRKMEEKKPPSQMQEDPLEDTENVDPPRALPAIADIYSSDSIAAPLQDNIYSVPAFCGLKCGPGTCHMERTGSSWISRCLCPMGTGGDRCSVERSVSAPQFSGQSYVSLPTLQNAYSDLHLSLEFRPTSWTGLLLLTGETLDMTGDYLALVLRDGYVELRLDCGTGPGVVRTTSQVHLDTWNHLSVFRHDWGVWVQLNGGKKEEGRSQGLFSRITFNQPVYIGGSGEIRNVKNFLGVDGGFQGCVRNLEINNKQYNFNLFERGGDSLSGRDVGECSVPGCSESTCGRGECMIEGSVFKGCNCPLGTSGEACQIEQHVQIPRFAGNSYIRHVGLGDAALIWLELEIVFKPSREQGLLLYNGNRNDGKGDFMAVFLNQGYVEFAFDLGNGIAIARSSSKISTDSWHSVMVSRTGREVYLTLDGVEGSVMMTEGGFSQLSLSQNMWIGGVPEYRILSAYLPITKAFEGCIQKITVNGLSLDLVGGAVSGSNISPCQHPCSGSPCGPGICSPDLEGYQCQCPKGFQGSSCSIPLLNSTPIPGFSGDSFLLFNNPDLYQNLAGTVNSINIRLRLKSSHGLVLWVAGDGGMETRDYLLLGVDRGYLQFWFNVGGGETVLEYNSTKIDDGLWHRIRATRMEQTASLMVDNGEVLTGSARGKLKQLNPTAGLYIGGTEEETGVLTREKYRAGLSGCIAELSIGNMVNINMVQLAERGRNIDSCYKP